MKTIIPIRAILLSFLVLSIWLAACQPAPGLKDGAGQNGIEDGVPVEVDGKTIYVDRVVSGFLCDDTWKGVIYVAEDVQVKDWQDNPDFLRDCNLVIEPSTVVYVYAHKATRFSKGCSCHE